MSREAELTAEMREEARDRRHERIRQLREQHARGAAPRDDLIRKSFGDVTLRTAEVEAPDGLVLFGDDRDRQLVDALGLVISIARRERRAELDAALAERDLHLKKIAQLELKVAELTGAVDVLRGKEPPSPAQFPKVKAWVAGTISYAREVVTHEGNTWQARCDTAQAPGLPDWTCLASAGRDGSSFGVRGTFNPTDSYAFLDVVACNGASFVARKNLPGECPGPGWQLLSKVGKRGERGVMGLTGPRGERGEAAPAICAWELDRARYVATPVMSTGERGPCLELRALFEQFLMETQS